MQKSQSEDRTYGFLKDRYTLDQRRLPAELVCSSVVIHQLHQSWLVTCEVHIIIKMHPNSHMCTSKRETNSFHMTPERDKAAQSQQLSAKYSTNILRCLHHER